MPHKINFRVVHASGQDDLYKASELNYHSPLTKGWQSSKFCLYPQDIVLQLSGKAKLRKIQILSHQYLIATKIEFYVGDVPDSSPANLHNVRYTRLGYIALSDNEKTGYQARELKSVHVEAAGLFLKLVIHKNHINKHNLYNQVGIVAVNVIGDDSSSNLIPSSDKISFVTTERPDYISPIDDLAFDMYLDSRVADDIRCLERKKREAVQSEKYEYAGRLKNVISDLQKIGEKLGRYEVEKRQAIENEDYETAGLKKIEMDELKTKAYLDLKMHEFLDTPAWNNNNSISLQRNYDYDRGDGPYLPLTSNDKTPRSPRNGLVAGLPDPSSGFASQTPYDDRILPALKKSRPPENDIPIDATSKPDYQGDSMALVDAGVKPAVSWRNNNERGQGMDQDESQEDNVDPDADDVSGELTEKDMRDASLAIDTLGLHLVKKAYNKSWAHREDALVSALKICQSCDPANSKDSFRAAVQLSKRGIADGVFAVFRAACNLLTYLLTDFTKQHRISKQEVAWAVDKVLSELLHKAGDTAQHNRDTARDYIVGMSNFPEVMSLQVVTHECIKPFKKGLAPRLAQSHSEVVELLYKSQGLKHGLTVDSLMRFSLAAFEHTSAEVRSSALRLVLGMYKQLSNDRERIKEYLPSDDEKTRRNVLYKEIFEAFDRIDGKPSKSEIKKMKAEEEAAKQREINVLQKQLAQVKDMTSGKAPIDPNMAKNPRPAAKTKRTGKDNSEGRSKLHPPDLTDDSATIANLECTCIFCGEVDNSFNEEGLDLHYWKYCPMLKRCAYCKQIIEIASLSEHYLGECVAKDNFKKCDICTEAVVKAEYSIHKQKYCSKVPNGVGRCILCHSNIVKGEDAWKKHLMVKDACKGNVRLSQRPMNPSEKQNKPPKGAPKK